jgi:hypothetical protein
MVEARGKDQSEEVEEDDEDCIVTEDGKIVE